jgi:hypothetical protein
LSRRFPILFTRAPVQPPSAFYVGTDDVLRIAVLTRNNPYSFEVRGRILLPSGQVTTIRQVVRSIEAVATNTFVVPLIEGFLLGVSLAAVSASPLGVFGNFYAQVAIGKGLTTGTFASHILIGGYLSDDGALSWPGGQLANTADPQTAEVTLNAGNQAVGAEAIVRAIIPEQWNVISIIFQLVTSAAVANREVRFQIVDVATELYRAASNFVQPASTTHVYVVSQLPIAGLLGTNLHHIPIPNLWGNGSNFNYQTLTTLLQAGDQYQNIVVRYRLRMKASAPL